MASWLAGAALAAASQALWHPVITPWRQRYLLQGSAGEDRCCLTPFSPALWYPSWRTAVVASLNGGPGFDSVWPQFRQV